MVLLLLLLLLPRIIKLELRINLCIRAGVPKLEIRLGAIYILRYIKEDYPDLGRPVDELLTALIHERSDFGIGLAGA